MYRWVYKYLFKIYRFLYSIFYYWKHLIIYMLKESLMFMDDEYKNLQLNANSKSIKLDYKFNGRKYELEIKNNYPKHCKFSKAIKIDDWKEGYVNLTYKNISKDNNTVKDISKSLVMYKGPFNNYNNMNITPKYLGYKYIAYYNFRGKLVKVFSPDDKLT